MNVFTSVQKDFIQLRFIKTTFA